MHPPLPYSLFFFYRDSDANQTIIWLQPTQRHTLNTFYNFTYFFQVLESNKRFQKIPKNTVNLYSEFFCKLDLLKLILQSRNIFGDATSLFVSGIDRPCFLAIRNKDINNIYLK